MTTVIRSKWFAQLASLTYPQSPGQAAEAFKPYLPMFSDMTDEAFTRASLEAVATSPRKMAIPSYDEIRKPLASWWRDNRPFQPTLPAPIIPDRVPPTEAEKAIVSALTREAKAILAEAIAVKAAGGKPPSPPRTHYLGEAHLLAEYESKAKLGGPLAGAAQMRADGLRRKMLRDADEQLMAHREQQARELADVGEVA